MNTTTSTHAYQGIRQMLTRGELAPGQRVSQSKLARQLGCSTVPVVEAMRRLESEGLLVKQPRKMAKVRELSSADLEGLYLLREGLEAVTSRLCAMRISDEQIRRLQELASAYETGWEQNQREHESDIAIHRHIAECAGCPLLVAELERLMLIERTAGRMMQNSKRQAGQAYVHRAVVQAIADGDADSAEYLMKKHIQNGYEEAMRELSDQKVL